MRRDEPMEPACVPCREKRGTCFPGPCKIYVARQERLTARYAEVPEPPTIIRDERQRELI